MSEAPDVEAIRALVRERVAATSYRRVAAQIGCSASGLHSFATRGSTPYRSQRRRLERWYAGLRDTPPPREDPVMRGWREELVRMGWRMNPVGIIRSIEAPMGDPDETPEAAREYEAALLRRFVSGTDSERAESFMTIYGRFRAAVREELERAGLAAQEAEQRVGAVFGRTLAALQRFGAQDGDPTLRERLMEAAHYMAQDPEWRPSP